MRPECKSSVSRRFVAAASILLSLVFSIAILPAYGQDRTLDILDGETLYEGGWLFTLNYELESRTDLRSGTNRIPDPLDREETEQTVTLAAHYGLRYDLQLSLLSPFRFTSGRADSPGGVNRFSTESIGDLAVVAKWRFYRFDAHRVALNAAMLAGLELPTGDYDATEDGRPLPADLQPGSGSLDPLVGFAATYEPGRWRHNALFLYKRNGENDDHLKRGDELTAELAVGNRFWLEPYPGPFMRLDAITRYRHEFADRVRGHLVRDSGRSVATVGLNLAFRPRPSLDFQLFTGYPIWQSVRGEQLGDDWNLSFSFGYRF